MKTKTIKHKFTINAPAEKIYDALLDSDIHSEITGGEAKVSNVEGDEFTTFDGYAQGKNLKLNRPNLIVQNWRADEDGWPEEHFSKITFEIDETDGISTIKFTQEELPEDAADDIEQGWNDYYWGPMEEYFN
ncbi:MAG TPA: SRPBCC domain-containing protein [Candidatus Dojkabacteria bacterium]|jgi:activator of HSP90 ATPase